MSAVQLPINRRQYLELQNIGVRAFAPLEGFMTENEFTSVVETMRLPDGQVFPLPVVFDVTHSLQLPGGGDGVTTGQAEYIEPLAAAGVAAGVDAVFLEIHEEPARAKSDAQNALRLDRLEPLLERLLRIDAAARG